jgi:hypothetical protein
MVRLREVLHQAMGRADLLSEFESQLDLIICKLKSGHGTGKIMDDDDEVVSKLYEDVCEKLQPVRLALKSYKQTIAYSDVSEKSKSVVSPCPGK